MKIDAKELRKPDKFREAVSNAIVFLSDNYKKILIGLGIVVLIVVGVFAVMLKSEGNKQDANSEFGEAAKSYADGKNEVALEKFLAVTKEHPQEDVSKLALYYAAAINYEIGKYDEAIRLSNDFLKSGLQDQLLKDAAYLTLGLANFNKGNWQQAIDNLSKLDTEGSPYENQAKLHIGLSLEKLGKTGEAEKIYKELLSVDSRQ